MAIFDSSLPVTTKISTTYEDASRLSVLILQHILPDTLSFVRILQAADIKIPLIVAKPNSIHAETMAKLQQEGIQVACHSYRTLETTPIMAELVERAALAAAFEGRRLVIIDIGGYFGQALSSLSEQIRSLVLGVVEVTTYGHNRYVSALPAMKVPVISLARSPLKSAEAQIVGEAAVTAADTILRRCGVLIQGRRAGVIGYGFIGEAIADALRSRGLAVGIYDRDPKKLLKASLRGFQVTGHKRGLMGDCDFLFSATGTRAVDYLDMAHAKDGLTLISAGSKANEFDIDGLKAHACIRTQTDPAVQEYQTDWGKRIRTLCNGSAVNFHIQSCPEEVMDVVFAEQLACCYHLAQVPCALGVLHELSDAIHRDIAAIWLHEYKRDLVPLHIAAASDEELPDLAPVVPAPAMMTSKPIWQNSWTSDRPQRHRSLDAVHASGQSLLDTVGQASL